MAGPKNFDLVLPVVGGTVGGNELEAGSEAGDGGWLSPKLEVGDGEAEDNGVGGDDGLENWPSLGLLVGVASPKGELLTELSDGAWLRLSDGEETGPFRLFCPVGSD